MPALSHITHVLFRREDGWTPTSGAIWIETRLGRFAPKTYKKMVSAGGEKLKSGDYIVYKLRATGAKPTSYGYSNEMANFPGVWFKFGGQAAR